MAIVHSEPGGYVALLPSSNGNTTISSVSWSDLAPVFNQQHISENEQLPVDHHENPYGLYVSSEYRGRHLGVRLMREAMRITQTLGGNQIQVISAEKAQGFYRRLTDYGFEVIEKKDARRRSVFTISEQ